MVSLSVLAINNILELWELTITHHIAHHYEL